METLVTGAGGLLGGNVVATARNREWSPTGTYHTTDPDLGAPTRECDIRSEERVEDVLDAVSPDAVVHCAAMTDVDACERDPETALAVNADATEFLASACDRRGIPFLYVSTDYVFDGTADTPYCVDDSPAPRQAYGRSKLAGERATRDVHDAACIVRLSFVYGVDRSDGSLVGFPAWVRGRLSGGEPVPLFVDQHVSPTRAGQAATTICDLLEAEAVGTFHVASRSCVTPRQFGEEVCRRIDGDRSLLSESRLDEDGRPASRPAYTCLDVSGLEETLGRRQPTLDGDLDRISGYLGRS